ncbi:MAG: DUF3737 family protein [Clostridiales bacterium]|nr:DUF3737 family protein [Clostridiales bacterium]
MAVKIENKTMDEERALYGLEYVQIENCKFQGPADGESALKECGVVEAKNCYFDLRYPLWHDRVVTLENCELTEKCRAALWYSQNINIVNSKLHGIKALRECKSTVMRDCDIISPEFGWSSSGIRLTDSTATSEYFMMRAKNLAMRRLNFKGKYSFQYVEDAIIMDSTLNTKDAFWHSKNVTVENSVVIGEYLGWYSKNLTFKNCTIIGTQPLCYCKNLKLIDCVMQDTDLSFERSEVYAVLRGKIDSIKNPTKGVIKVPEVGEIIRDDPYAKGKIMVDPNLLRGYRNE